MKSEDFIQFNFPCKDCLVRAACQDKPGNDQIKHLYDMDNPRCLAIPKFNSDEKTYMKALIECMANLFPTVINNMQKSEDPQTSRETHNNIPMQYVIMLGQMTALMQWIVNSTSLDIGELQDFDRFEVNKKSKNCRV